MHVPGTLQGAIAEVQKQGPTDLPYSTETHGAQAHNSFEELPFGINPKQIPRCSKTTSPLSMSPPHTVAQINPQLL
jgi:hypothetical protein